VKKVDPLENWTRFHPPNERVSILLPGTPQHRTEVGGSKSAKYETQQYMIRKDGVIYSLTCADIPGEVPTGKLLEKMLDSSREGTLRALKGGKLLWEKRITLNDRPGRDLAFDSPSEGMLLRQRVWLLFGTRMYILLAKRPCNDNSAAEVEAFFASFQ